MSFVVQSQRQFRLKHCVVQDHNTEMSGLFQSPKPTATGLLSAVHLVMPTPPARSTCWDSGTIWKDRSYSITGSDHRPHLSSFFNIFQQSKKFKSYCRRILLSKDFKMSLGTKSNALKKYCGFFLKKEPRCKCQEEQCCKRSKMVLLWWAHHMWRNEANVARQLIEHRLPHCTGGDLCIFLPLAWKEVVAENWKITRYPEICLLGSMFTAANGMQKADTPFSLYVEWQQVFQNWSHIFPFICTESTKLHQSWMWIFKRLLLFPKPVFFALSELKKIHHKAIFYLSFTSD